MPPAANLKDTAKGMTAFVCGGGDPAPTLPAPPFGPKAPPRMLLPANRRADTPQIPSGVATRQAIAEAARLPLVKNSRFPTAANLPAGPVLGPVAGLAVAPLSLTPRSPRARADSDERRRREFFSAPSDAGGSLFSSPTRRGGQGSDAGLSVYRGPPNRITSVIPVPMAAAPHPATNEMGPFIIGDNGLIMLSGADERAPRAPSSTATAVAGENGHPGPAPASQNRQYSAAERELPHRGQSIRRTRLPIMEMIEARQNDAHGREARHGRFLADRQTDSAAGAIGLQTTRCLSPTVESSHYIGRINLVSHEVDNQSAARDTAFQDGHDIIEDDYDGDHTDQRQHTPPTSRERPAHRVGLLESSLPAVQYARPDPLQPPQIKPLRAASPGLPEEPRHKARKRNRRSCDYNDLALSTMDFAALREQDFDFDPSSRAATSQQASPAAQAELGLDQKLRHYAGRGPVDQRRFFNGLPLGDWDAAGDWFADQFGAALRRLRDARRARRSAVAAFEDEVAARERAVRAQSLAVERRLGRMRRDGERVVDEMAVADG